MFIAFEILVLFPEDEGLRSSVRSQRFLLLVIDKLLQTLWLDEIMYLNRVVVPVGDIEHEIYLLREIGFVTNASNMLISFNVLLLKQLLEQVMYSPAYIHRL